VTCSFGGGGKDHRLGAPWAEISAAHVPGGG
jgi:hypothetical protein